MPKQLPKVTLGPGQFVAVYGQQLRVNKSSDHYTVVDGRPYPSEPSSVHTPLLVYSGPDHDSPHPLDGVTLSGTLWAWVQDSGILSVAWSVDGASVPGTTRDLGGTNADGTSAGYDTTKLTNAGHSFKAVVTYIDGTASAVSSNAVSNAVAPPVEPPPVIPPPVDPPPVVIPPPGSDPSVPPGFTTIQKAIDGQPTGAVFGIPAGTYPETFTPKAGQRLVPIGGTVIIEGGNSRQAGIVIAAPDVTLDLGSAASAWFEVRNHRPPYQHGAIQHNGGDRLTLKSVRSHDNPGPGKGQYTGTNASIGGGLALNGGTGHLIEDGDYYANQTMGIHANGGGTGKDWTFRRVTMRDNNSDGYNLEWHSAGLKATQLDGLLIEDSIVHGNNADGIWGDINTRNAVIRRNRLDHNTKSGIHSEIEELWTIEDNVIWECGWGRTEGNGWGAGLQIVENRLDTLSRNTVAWCNRGITFWGNVDPGRKGSFPVSKPGSYDGLVMASNVVITSDGYLVWTASDVSPKPVDATGKYWSAVTPVASSGPSGSTNLSTAERDAILSAAGIPLKSEH